MSARAAHERRPASPEKSLQRASWERLRRLSGPLGVLSGASWGVLEVSWGALGTLKASSGRLGSLRGLLEASWKPLGGLLTTKILPKNPDRGPKTVQETSWEALDYQEAPKEPRKRAKDGPKSFQELLSHYSLGVEPRYSLGVDNGTKKRYPYRKKGPLDFCSALKKRPTYSLGISKRPSQGFDTFSLSQGVVQHKPVLAWNGKRDLFNEASKHVQECL